MKRSEMIERIMDYYEGLDQTDFERILSAFHDDMIYKHPKLWDFEESEPEYHGKESFKSLYLEKRGKREFDHKIADIIIEGDRASVLGFAPRLGFTWVAYVRFKEGKIYRFIYGTLSGKPPLLE